MNHYNKGKRFENRVKGRYKRHYKDWHESLYVKPFWKNRKYEKMLKDQKEWV